MTRRRGFWLALAVAVILLWTFLPMYWTVKYAFMTKTEISRFPPPFIRISRRSRPSITSSASIIRRGTGRFSRRPAKPSQIVLGLRNSLIVAIVVTAITTCVVVPLSYIFARLEFRFKAVLLTSILLSVSLPPVSTLIPFYTLYVQLGLTGTLTGLIIVTLTITIPIVAWMLIGFFRNLPPVELLARIDGFSRLYALMRIVVPMARSGIMVAAVIAFLFSWNEYVYAQVLVTGSDAVTLPAAMSGFPLSGAGTRPLAASLLLSLRAAVLRRVFCAKAYRRDASGVTVQGELMARIELHDVSKTYGEHTAVRGLDMTIADGELLVLLGPSGCGKSTTMNMIAGLDSPTSGAIRFDGVDVIHRSPHRAQHRHGFPVLAALSASLRAPKHLHEP